jgi:hypothetical protein
MLGGAAQARDTMAKVTAQMKLTDTVIESFTFPEDPVFYTTDRQQYALVPYKMIISIRGVRVESLNYQFGNKLRGATNWTYIEGSRITTNNVYQFFPDFPKDAKFLTTSRTRL